VIQVIDADTCTACNICVTVCPTNVFDRTAGIPVIARQKDCQTCFLCELYCPDDSLFVAPHADGRQPIDISQLKRDGMLGSYRRAIGWTDDTRDTRDLDRSYVLFGR
jgi:NAD-dependent dihydropyrimidine dehydrogenase PreA subunit